MDHNFWAFVGLGLLIVVPFLVIVAKALGAGRRAKDTQLPDSGAAGYARDADN